LVNFQNHQNLNIKNKALVILESFCLYWFLSYSFISVFFVQYIESLFMKKDWEFKSFVFSNKVSYITWALIFVLILIASPSGMPPFIYFSY
jgi:magnesium-transporting ATPase (P-type)